MCGADDGAGRRRRRSYDTGSASGRDRHGSDADRRPEDEDHGDPYGRPEEDGRYARFRGRHDDPDAQDPGDARGRERPDQGVADRRAEAEVRCVPGLDAAARPSTWRRTGRSWRTTTSTSTGTCTVIAARI